MSAVEDASPRAPVGPTLRLFTFAYMALTLLLLVFFAVSGLPANSGASMGALIGAALYAGLAFARKARRPPRGREVWLLSLGSFAVSAGLSILLVVFTAVTSGTGIEELALLLAMLQRELTGPGLYLAIGIVSLMHILALWVAYGPLIRFLHRRTGTG